MNDQKTAAIYVRSAATGEVGSNNTIDEQIRVCREFGEKQGYSILEEHIFQEVGSGSLLDRPILKEVMRAAIEGKFNIIIIRSFDRLSRKESVASIAVATLLGYGVKVISVTEEVLPSEIDNELQKIATALRKEVDKIEREKITARSEAGRQEVK